MRYRRFITIGAVVAACSTLGAAPALASQPSAAHPVSVAAAHRGHTVAVPHSAGGPGCTYQNCFLQNASNLEIGEYRTPVLGHVVDQNGDCWPFSNCGFDSEYRGDEVLQFVAQDPSDAGQCLQTDSVHSHVKPDPCGSHNAGTYWVTVGNGGTRGYCNPHPVFWMVNVGITNHYDPYPYGEAMYWNTTLYDVYVATHLPISDLNQWCVIPLGDVVSHPADGAPMFWP